MNRGAVISMSVLESDKVFMKCINLCDDEVLSRSHTFETLWNKICRKIRNKCAAMKSLGEGHQ